MLMDLYLYRTFQVYTNTSKRFTTTLTFTNSDTRSHIGGRDSHLRRHLLTRRYNRSHTHSHWVSWACGWQIKLSKERSTEPPDHRTTALPREPLCFLIQWSPIGTNESLNLIYGAKCAKVESDDGVRPPEAHQNVCIWQRSNQLSHTLRALSSIELPVYGPMLLVCAVSASHSLVSQQCFDGCDKTILYRNQKQSKELRFPSFFSNFSLF